MLFDFSNAARLLMSPPPPFDVHVCFDVLRLVFFFFRRLILLFSFRCSTLRRLMPRYSFRPSLDAAFRPPMLSIAYYFAFATPLIIRARFKLLVIDVVFATPPDVAADTPPPLFDVVICYMPRLMIFMSPRRCRSLTDTTWPPATTLMPFRFAFFSIPSLMPVLHYVIR